MKISVPKSCSHPVASVSQFEIVKILSVMSNFNYIY